MKSISKGSKLVSQLSKGICLFTMLIFSSSALAEYYVVYSTPPAPDVMYQTQCTTVYKHKHKKVHYKKIAKKPVKKVSPVISVYNVYCNSNCGFCGSSSEGVVMMGVSQGCGYKAYNGQVPLRHSDYYYMQGIEDDYYSDPDIDGNTYDNDIYY